MAPTVLPAHPAAMWDLRGPGISDGSRWGYDAVLECWWAEVVADDGAVVRIDAEHLIPTVDGLARALAWRLARSADDLYLVLTAR